mmetsp:Transcript_2547/g.9778  ORF Transcript_2547/g.9778 Transcript_2547/m.9778 type:complete len:361 (+) Transcript_2547:2401-3483(+)
MLRTRAFEPRGTTRSTNSADRGWPRIDATSSRLSTSATASDSFSRPARGLASSSRGGAAAASRASAMTRRRHAHDRRASLPPLRTSPQPARSARQAICGSASGRASKMTSTTPSEVDRFSRTRPSASSRRSATRPRGSGIAASARAPAASDASFFCERPSRCLSAAGTSPSSPLAAASTSSALAARISSACASSASATAPRSAVRRSPGRDRSVCAAARVRSSNSTSASPPTTPPFTSCCCCCPTSGCCCCSEGTAGAWRRPPLLEATTSSASGTKRVPTSSPRTTLATTHGSAPFASATHLTPQSNARHAAATLASMPPRPLADLAPNSTTAPSKVLRRRDDGETRGRMRAPGEEGGLS